MRVRGVSLILLFGALASAQVGAAQAWTRPAGHAYVKLSRSVSIADYRFEVDGSRVRYDGTTLDASFSDNSHYAYVEYGLSSALTGILLLPLKRLSVNRPTGDMTRTGVGSIQLGVRYALQKALGIADERHRVAVNATLTLPAGYERNAAPALGSGQTDLDVVGAYGFSFYPVPVYAQAAVGYRYRSDFFGLSRTLDCSTGASDCFPAVTPEYDNEWLMRLEAGISPSPWLLVHAIASGTWSNGQPEIGFSVDNPIATRQRFTKVGGGVAVYPVPYVGLSVQYFETVSGKNTIDSGDWFFGIEYITDRR